MVTSGAAGGILLATAACIASNDIEKIRQLPFSQNMKNQVIIQKGNRTIYDHLIEVAGGVIVEIGSEERTLLKN